MSERDTVAHHIRKFCEIVDKLSEIGVTINDDLLVLILLTSLPKSFENFIIAVEIRDSLPTLEILKAKLLEEGARRRQHKTDQNGSDGKKAFVVQSDQKYVKNNSGKQNFKKPNNNSGLRCHNCGQTGHFAAHCRLPKKQNQQQRSFSARTHKFELNNHSWCVDSGATSHMCGERNVFEKFVEATERVQLADGNHMDSSGKGEVCVTTPTCMIRLKNVLFVPNLKCNFILVNKAVSEGMTVRFNSVCAKIEDQNRRAILIAQKIENLFVFKENLKQLCFVKPFPKLAQYRSQNIPELIHTDVCGPFAKFSIGGSKYFVTFVDDYSRRSFVYFIRTKDEVFEKFRDFKNMVENQSGLKIKAVRSDNGREYINNDFDRFFKENGIKRELSVVYTPQQNGVAERLNRTLTKMARSMLVESGLSEYLCIYIRHRCPTKALNDTTPYEMWTRKKPMGKHLRVFGSFAIALNKTQSNKLQPKGEECYMVGYSLCSKAYRLYDPKRHQIIERRDVYFDERKSKSTRENGTTQEDLQLLEDDPMKNSDVSRSCDEILNDKVPVNNDEEDNDEDHDHRSIDSAQKRPGRPKIIRSGNPGRPRKQRNLLNAMTSDPEVRVPEKFDDVQNNEYAREWRAAMQREYDSLINNNTWTLVDLPEGQKPIRSKWVFSLKTNKDGNIERFKARLVAKGCSQEYGVNYFETFSPAVRYATIRMLLALAAQHELYLHQLDVTTAYLNSELKEECCMRQRDGFISSNQPGGVLKLNKAIYGLKQSGKEWTSTLDSILREMGFVSGKNEPCLYQRRNSGKLALIAIYVDDLILGCSSQDDLTTIKRELANAFDIVDRGPISHILGMEVERDGDTGAITVGHRQYILNLLKKCGMTDCRPASTPLDAGYQIKRSDDTEKQIDPTSYQSLIGALMYLAVTTRPDISHSVSKLAQCNINPKAEHEVGAKHVLRYVAKTIDYKLRYYADNSEVCGYVDADWGGDLNDRKSYSGYLFMMAAATISWESKKQTIVALSTTEAEYVAL